MSLDTPMLYLYDVHVKRSSTFIDRLFGEDDFMKVDLTVYAETDESALKSAKHALPDACKVTRRHILRASHRKWPQEERCIVIRCSI